jgi:hypothetical protein
LLVRDERGRKVDEGQVVARFDFPADQQRAEAIVPAVGALDDPAPWLAVDAPDERRFALLPDMRRDATGADGGGAVAERVALIQAAVLWTSHTAAPLEHDRVERSRERPFVVQVRAA